MELNVRLIGLLQRVDLSSEDRRVENLLELSIGEELRVVAPISEEVAERVLCMAVGAPSTPTPRSVVGLGDMSPSVFEERAVSDSAPPDEPAPAPSVPSYTIACERERNGRPAVPPVRTVQADEMGNPLVPTAAAAPAPDNFLLDDFGISEA